MNLYRYVLHFVGICTFYRKCCTFKKFLKSTTIQCKQMICTFFGDQGKAHMEFSTQVHDHAHVICLKDGLSRSV